jgi:hypothetical protein
MTDEDFATVRAMETYGGGFVQALAAACHRADPENLVRLKAAFPEYWSHYSEMAKAPAGEEGVR